MKDDKHTHILDCAARFFARLGFRKTSVSDIASEAGVAKGTIYLAAKSKRDLFYQVLHREIRAGIAECAQLIDPRRSADELLPEVLAAEIDFFDNRPLVRQVLVGHAAQAVPEEAEEFEELRRIGRANLVEVIELGQRQNIFLEHLDADQVATLLQDIEVSTLLFHDQLPDVESLDHPRWRTALAVFLRGLRTTRRIADLEAQNSRPAARS